jgi:hypothetical protein
MKIRNTGEEEMKEEKNTRGEKEIHTRLWWKNLTARIRL